MTTNYTAPIRENRPGSPVRFSDFALLCARGIDFASTQRDEPLETPLREETIDPELIERVRIAAIDLEKATEREAPEWARDWREHTTQTLHAHQRRTRDTAHLRQRYEALLADVEAWQPPTELHTGLKTFMRDQLIQSIEADCNPTELTTFKSADEYRDAELKRLTTELSYYRRTLQEAQSRVSAQNDWIRTLWASLAAHPYNTALAAEQD